MAHRYAAILSCVGLLLCAACGPGPVDERVILMPVAEDPTVTFKVWFKVGSQDDPPGKEGLAYLTGQLISDGSTTENAYETILEKLYPLASGYHVRVDREMTVLTGRTHRDNLDAFFALFSDAYLRPAFAEDDFRRIRQNTLDYLEKTLRYASDEDLGKAALNAFVFEGTRYAHPIQGTVAGVGSIGLEDVKRFYATHYNRENAVVALGGGFDEALADRFRGTLAELSAAPESVPAAAPPPVPAEIRGRHVMLVYKPGADASISFGFPIDTLRGADDFYALWVANSWLGEHRNAASHLYQVIREARGMNYGDYSYIEAFPEGGVRNMPPTHIGRRQQMFEVWIRTLPNDDAVFALRAALRELDRLVENGLSEEQFALTREFLRKYTLHFAETTSARLGYALDDRFYGVDGDGHLARFRERLAALTREEVNAAVKRHLNADGLKIAIVTGDPDGLRAALVSGAPTPKEYASDPGEAVRREDVGIAAFPLEIEEERVTRIPVEEIFGD